MNAGASEAASRQAAAWIRAGIVAGFVTCVVYPLVTVAPLPRIPLVVLAAMLGPALAVASIGLRQALRLHEDSLASDLGALFNVIAGALLEAMLLVQLAVRLRVHGEGLSQPTVGVWLGLDVAWDVYIGCGTACFGIAMLSHPQFGRTMGVIGLVISVTLMAFNLLTVPAPPAEAGLIDIGPAVGVWYLAATILMARSMSWLKDAARERHADR